MTSPTTQPQTVLDISTDNLKAILASDSPTAIANGLRNSIKAIEELRARLKTESALSFRDQVAALEVELEGLKAQQWLPIESAPETMTECVVVRWVDDEGQEHRDFDCTEEGCWIGWHQNAEHVEIIGGHGVSYTPPYQQYLPLPAPPTGGV